MTEPQSEKRSDRQALLGETEPKLILYLRMIAKHRVQMRADTNSLAARESEAGRFASVEAFVLGLGEHTISVPHIRDSLEPATMRDCYRNAWDVALNEPNLIYTEGFAYSYGVGIEHAWLTDRITGDILDPTWAKVDSIHGIEPVAYEYMGIRFAAGFLTQRVHQFQQFGIFTTIVNAKNDLLRRGPTTELLNPQRADLGVLVTGVA